MGELKMDSLNTEGQTTGPSTTQAPAVSPERAKLLVDNKARLVNVPVEVIEHGKQYFTLPNPKYEQALKHGRYTGHLDKNLKFYELSPSDGFVFPRGQVRRCIKVLQKYGIKPEIQDNRRTLEPVVFDFKGQLRNYQQAAVNDICKRDSGVLEASTGSGKTVMALAVIAKRKQPTLILVHNKELLHQWADRIESFLGIKAGLVGDGKFEIRDVTVAIVNTAKKHLGELPQYFGQIIIDEAHRTPANMFTEVVTAFDSKFMLGLSATPYRNDGLTKLIHFTLGDLVHEVDPDILKENGAVLAPGNYKQNNQFPL
jgi:SNF2 family DNA or RNA helicase